MAADTFSFLLLLLLLVSILVLQISCFSMDYSSSISIKPPINNIYKPKGGGEYGYRQLSAKESKPVILKWEKSLGIINGNNKIEMFEILRTLDVISNIMPGKTPQRFEYMLFGELVDGSIECISATYCCKVSCPWLMDVILIAQYPNKYSDEKTSNMINFINEACLDNACLPNFDPLYRYPATLKIEKFIKGNNDIYDNDETVIAALYNAINSKYKAIGKINEMLYLDSVIQINTFPFWHRICIPHPDSGLLIPLYLRQTLNSLSDFEFSFTSPLSGTTSGRGTVGAYLLLEEHNAQKIVPQADKNYFESLKIEVGKKIKHPNISHFKLKSLSQKLRK